MESVQTQQERDRQTRLERRRQQERERRARETPEERDRRRSLRNQRERRRARCAARCASALALLERVCTCIIIRIPIYIRELAHARPPMSSISDNRRAVLTTAGPNSAYVLSLLHQLCVGTRRFGSVSTLPGRGVSQTTHCLQTQSRYRSCEKGELISYWHITPVGSNGSYSHTHQNGHCTSK